jgi:hypothetical protein
MGIDTRRTTVMMEDWLVIHCTAPQARLNARLYVHTFLLVLLASWLYLVSSPQALPQRAADILADSLAPRGAPLAPLPLQFEANQGQAEASARFLAHGPGYNLLLTSTEAVVTLASPRGVEEPAVVRLQFAGAAAVPEMEGVEPLPGVAHYYLGQDQSQWRTGIPTYRGVRYHDLYPGIDLLFYGNQEEVEYDFIVAPGSDPAAITLRVEGAQRLELADNGDLLLATPGGPLRLRRPYLYQQRGNERQEISGAFVLLDEQQFGFTAGDYDPRLPLVIDPVLEYGTYLGGNGSDFAYDATADSAGNLYITGSTNSTNFPLMNPAQDFGGGGISCPRDAAPYRLCYDVFVTKLNPAGNTILYSTYIGLPGEDEGYAIAVDGSGNAFVAGYLSLNGQPPLEDSWLYQNALVLKLTPTGAFGWAAWWGNDQSEARAIALDGAGNIYVAGQTTNDGFPVSATAVQNTKLEVIDGFVSIVNPTGEYLLYSSFLGGSGEPCGVCYSTVNGIAVDSGGKIYVTGQAAPSFPTTASAYQDDFGGYWMAFVAKIDPAKAGTAGLLYSTYLGGSRNEFGNAIALAPNGDVLVAGSTNSDNFPTTAGAYDRTCGTDGACNHSNNMVCEYPPFNLPPNCQLDAKADVFVARLDLTKTGAASLVYSTYVGGAGKEEGRALALDSAGNSYVTGYTASPNFPLLQPIQPASGGKNDAFVFKLNSSGSALTFSTFFGGSGDDYAQGIAVTGGERAHIVGYTDSSDFPTASPLQPRGPAPEAFIARLDTKVSTPGPDPGPGLDHRLYLPSLTK